MLFLLYVPMAATGYFELGEAARWLLLKIVYLAQERWWDCLRSLRWCGQGHHRGSALDPFDICLSHGHKPCEPVHGAVDWYPTRLDFSYFHWSLFRFCDQAGWISHAHAGSATLCCWDPSYILWSDAGGVFRHLYAFQLVASVFVTCLTFVFPPLFYMQLTRKAKAYENSKDRWG